MKHMEAYPNKPLRAEDLDGEMTVTVLSLTTRGVWDARARVEGEPEDSKKRGALVPKPILLVKEFPNPIIVIPTNWETLVKLFGKHPDPVGKRLTLYVSNDNRLKKDGIRFRAAPQVNQKTGEIVDGRPAGANGNGAHAQPPGGDLRQAAPAADTLTMDEAIEALKAAGIGPEAFKAEMLKANGRAGYSPSRDTALVRRMIASVPQTAEEPF